MMAQATGFERFASEQISAYRTRYNIPAHVPLSLAADACKVCGGTVTMHGDTCVACGAAGKQRARNANSNRAVFTETIAPPSSVPPFSAWLIAEKFNSANLAEFRDLLAAGRLDRIGWCAPSGRIGNFATPAAALVWIEAGRNVYADVGIASPEVR